jgi:hypothetical protein
LNLHEKTFRSRSSFVALLLVTVHDATL